MSRENSHFKESRKEGGGKLQISYVGYKTQDVDIAPNIRVKLEPDAQAVEAVVVTGMTKMDKRLFTGAADQLVADDVKLAGMADISRGLEGRSAGVSVQNVSGTFGTAPKIRVRGATSIYGSSKPLWVVDGVIMEDIVDIDADDLSSGDATTLIASAIAGLNAEDIESFNILKDGSATSIYGARAMAGVIVITTKRGRARREHHQLHRRIHLPHDSVLPGFQHYELAGPDVGVPWTCRKKAGSTSPKPSPIRKAAYSERCTR